jgi:hypothetical protein
MEIIKETILTVMQELSDKKSAPDKHNPQTWLENILTQKELRHIKVNYFKLGILVLLVDSSTWLYQLNLKKEHILESLRRNGHQVGDIRFYIGEIVCPKKQPNPRKTKG